MEFIIYWMYREFKNRLSFSDKDTANAVWQALKSCPHGVTGLRTEKRGHEATNPSDEEYQVVRIAFVRGGKEYTYLTRKEVTSKRVVVETGDGPQVVQVLWAGWKTRAELEAVCPFSRYTYIVGEVIE